MKDNRPRCSVCDMRMETVHYKEGYTVTLHRWSELDTTEALGATLVVANLTLTSDTGPHHHKLFESTSNGK